jgi:ABC-2 type transport system permease protein
LAHRHAVQSAGLFDLGFPLELFDIADVHVGLSVAVTLLFLALRMAIVSWFFKTGYRLKN